MTRCWLALLVLAMAAASCTSSADKGSTASTEPEPSTDAVPSAEVEDKTESTESSQFGLPAGYELASTSTSASPGPPDSTTLRTVVAVGPSPSDPRLVEYTLFGLADVETTATTVELTDLPETSTTVDIEGGSFAFLSAATNSPSGRSELFLPAQGPSVDATFRAAVDDGVVAVGGSASLQPSAIEVLLNAMSVDEDSDPEMFPPQMSVLVDGVLPEGRVLELTSVHGTTSVVAYDGVGREWFDYFTWGDPDVPIPANLAALAGAVSLQPSTNYGNNGAAQDPVRLSFWLNDRLTLIVQPETVPTDVTHSVAGLMLDESTFDVLAAEAGALAPTSEPELPDPDPERLASDAPSAEDMAAFQQFTERRLDVEFGQPIVFDFVPDFPTDGIDFDFISSELWLVASALGLTGDGLTHDGANQSRIDAIRGTPGVIGLQPTRTETDVVVVHEMVHVLGPSPAEVASAEPFSMSQVVAEGNAHRIAYDYLLTLDPEEQAIMEPFPHIFPAGGDPRISRAVQDLLEFPYDEGRLFMAAAAEDGGESRVLEVIRRPPVSTEQVLFLDAWLNDDQPTDVPVPPVPTGTTQLDEGTLGVYLLLLVATEANRPDEALVSLQEWSGDSYVLYEAGPEVCLQARLEFDSSQAASNLADILQVVAGSVDIESNEVRATFCA